MAGLDDWVRGAFDHRRVLLSVNRYERKKRGELAIEGLAELLEREPALRRDVRMVVAGGYDERLRVRRGGAPRGNWGWVVVPACPLARRSFLLTAYLPCPFRKTESTSRS